jgi:hypothetical protein
MQRLWNAVAGLALGKCLRHASGDSLHDKGGFGNAGADLT